MKACACKLKINKTVATKKPTDSEKTDSNEWNTAIVLVTYYKSNFYYIWSPGHSLPIHV